MKSNHHRPERSRAPRPRAGRCKRRGLTVMQISYVWHDDAVPPGLPVTIYGTATVMTAVECGVKFIPNGW
jgi:hypothetical protein